VFKLPCYICGLGWTYYSEARPTESLKCPICKSSISVFGYYDYRVRFNGILEYLVFRAVKALSFMAYVFLKAGLRLLIGRNLRNWALDILGIHYRRVEGVRYGIFESYEPYVHKVIRKILEKSQSRTFIDIGAHVGIYTLYAYRLLSKKHKEFRVVAVEPNPQSYNVLERKVGRMPYVELIKEAVYVQDGEEKLWLGGSSSLNPTKHHVEGGFISGETINVKAVRLDSLFRRLGLEKVSLVKIDVEGAEYTILTDPVLDLSPVENMIVEVHYNYQSKESREIMSALARKGFKVIPLYPNTASWIYHLLACRADIR